MRTKKFLAGVVVLVAGVSTACSVETAESSSEAQESMNQTIAEQQAVSEYVEDTTAEEYPLAEVDEVDRVPTEYEAVEECTRFVEREVYVFEEKEDFWGSVTGTTGVYQNDTRSELVTNKVVETSQFSEGDERIVDLVVVRSNNSSANYRCVATLNDNYQTQVSVEEM